MQGNRHVLIRALCAAALLFATAAPAQTIYRCGNSYSQTPCAGGTAVAPDGPRDDAREKARKAQESNTRRDMKLANDLEKSRLKEEAAATRASRTGRVASNENFTSDDYDEARAGSKKKPPYFTARAAEPARKKGKAEHAAEKKSEKADRGAAPARP